MGNQLGQTVPRVGDPTLEPRAAVPVEPAGVVLPLGQIDPDDIDRVGFFAMPRLRLEVHTSAGTVEGRTGRLLTGARDLAGPATPAGGRPGLALRERAALALSTRMPGRLCRAPRL